MLWWMAAVGLGIGFTAGLIGAGPSIFTVLAFTHLAGLDLERAITTSLVVVAAMSCVALVPYLRAHAVVWRAALGFTAASTSGAYVAGHLSERIPTAALKYVFVLAMLVAGLAMLLKREARAAEKPWPPSLRLAFLVTVGVGVGSLTGTVGLGGGFAVVPLLVLVLGVPMRSAVGTSLFVIAVDTLAALVGRGSQLASVDWPLAVVVAAGASVGSLAGAKTVTHLNAAFLRRVFGVVMLVAALAQLASVLKR